MHVIQWNPPWKKEFVFIIINSFGLKACLSLKDLFESDARKNEIEKLMAIKNTHDFNTQSSICFSFFLICTVMQISKSTWML